MLECWDNSTYALTICILPLKLNQDETCSLQSDLAQSCDKDSDRQIQANQCIHHVRNLVHLTTIQQEYSKQHFQQQKSSNQEFQEQESSNYNTEIKIHFLN